MSEVVKEMVVVDTPVVWVILENWSAGMLQMETRLLPESEMRRRPSGRIDIPVGSINWPSPLPYDPNFTRKLPLLSNFWTRLLLLPTTKKLPKLSIVIPFGYSNCPSPVPLLPHLVTKAPEELNFWTR